MYATDSGLHTAEYTFGERRVERILFRGCGMGIVSDWRGWDIGTEAMFGRASMGAVGMMCGGHDERGTWREWRLGTRA